MGLKSTALGFVLVVFVLGGATSLPVSAQTPSTFSFTLQESSPGACWFYGVGFSAMEGQQLTVQWGENLSAVGPVSMDFYIAPLSAVQAFWRCDTGPAYIYWNEGAFGTANWTASSTGEYAVLLVNYSSYSLSGTVSVTAVNATISASPIGPGTVIRQECPGGGCKRSGTSTVRETR